MPFKGGEGRDKRRLAEISQVLKVYRVAWISRSTAEPPARTAANSFAVKPITHMHLAAASLSPLEGEMPPEGAEGGIQRCSFRWCRDGDEGPIPPSVC